MLSIKFTGTCCYVVHQFHWRMLLCCPSVSLGSVVMLSISFTGVCCYVVHQFHWRMLLCCPSVSLENVVMLSIIRTISIEYHTGISCLVLVILLGTVS